MPEHKQAIDRAMHLRLTGETYLTAYRQLQRHELKLNRKQYYNLVRGGVGKGGEELDSLRSPDKVINALLGVIHEAGFKYEARWRLRTDEWTGQAVKEGLEQVVFFLPVMEDHGRRFCSDFAIQIDATFNTNRANLLLGVATDVANTEYSFPLCYSLQKEEDKVSWQFLIGVLCGHYFKARKPKVVVSDRGEGLIAALPELPL